MVLHDAAIYPSLDAEVWLNSPEFRPHVASAHCPEVWRLRLRWLPRFFQRPHVIDAADRFERAAAGAVFVQTGHGKLGRADAANQREHLLQNLLHAVAPKSARLPALRAGL